MTRAGSRPSAVSGSGCGPRATSRGEAATARQLPLDHHVRPAHPRGPVRRVVRELGRAPAHERHPARRVRARDPRAGVDRHRRDQHRVTRRAPATRRRLPPRRRRSGGDRRPQGRRPSPTPTASTGRSPPATSGRVPRSCGRSRAPRRAGSRRRAASTRSSSTSPCRWGPDEPRRGAHHLPGVGRRRPHPAHLVAARGHRWRRARHRLPGQPAARAFVDVAPRRARTGGGGAWVRATSRRAPSSPRDRTR